EGWWRVLELRRWRGRRLRSPEAAGLVPRFPAGPGAAGRFAARMASRSELRALSNPRTGALRSTNRMSPWDSPLVSLDPIPAWALDPMARASRLTLAW